MLKRTVDLVSSLEGIGLIATLILGIGFLGFIPVTWVLHQLGTDHIAAGGIVAVAALALSAAALARIPVALLLVLCSAVVVGAAFLSGNSQLFLP